MPDQGFEPSVPEPPRSGQYVVVKGYVDSEGGGDIEVRLRPCPNCRAAVAETDMDAHESSHAAQGGSDPKAAR